MKKYNFDQAIDYLSIPGSVLFDRFGRTYSKKQKDILLRDNQEVPHSLVSKDILGDSFYKMRPTSFDVAIHELLFSDKGIIQLNEDTGVFIYFKISFFIDEHLVQKTVLSKKKADCVNGIAFNFIDFIKTENNLRKLWFVDYEDNFIENFFNEVEMK